MQANKNAGLEIVRVNNSILYQQLGEEVNSSSKSYFSHSPLRCYYMTRNRFYYNKKYGISSFVSYLQTIKHVTLILRFESYDKNKLKMIKEEFLIIIIIKWGNNHCKHYYEHYYYSKFY